MSAPSKKRRTDVKASGMDVKVIWNCAGCGQHVSRAAQVLDDKVKCPKCGFEKNTKDWT